MTGQCGVAGRGRRRPGGSTGLPGLRLPAGGGKNWGRAVPQPLLPPASPPPRAGGAASPRSAALLALRPLPVPGAVRAVRLWTG